MRRRLLIAIPYCWLLLFFVLPFLILFKISLSDVAIAIPPYEPLIEFSKGLQGLQSALHHFDFESYHFIFSDPLYVHSYLSSLKIAAIATFGIFLLAFPLAYGIARVPPHWQPLLIMFVMLPFWTSFLIRIYALIGLLKRQGLLNQFLEFLGVIKEPLIILDTPLAVYVGIIYSYLPFMVLPIYSSLQKIDPRLLEAALNLGASPLKTFWKITFPLSLPGVYAGFFIVFIPVVGEFVIPDLLGGANTLMIGKTLWNEFFTNHDWPVASAVGIILILVLMLPLFLFESLFRKQRDARL